MKFEAEDGVTTPCSTATTTTPTNTAVRDDLWDHIASRDVVPWAGETFIIRDRTHGQVITLKDRDLRLEAYTSGVEGRSWICVDNDGWFGFRNAVSGTYIGHNGKGKLCAKAFEHRDHEFFCAKRHPGGGYLLLTKRGSKLWKVGIGEGSNELVETEGEGTVWEFIKVPI